MNYPLDNQNYCCSNSTCQKLSNGDVNCPHGQIQPHTQKCGQVCPLNQVQAGMAISTTFCRNGCPNPISYSTGFSKICTYDLSEQEKNFASFCDATLNDNSDMYGISETSNGILCTRANTLLKFDQCYTSKAVRYNFITFITKNKFGKKENCWEDNPNFLCLSETLRLSHFCILCEI